MSDATTVDLSDDDIIEIIGDGSCTHLPQVRMALEIVRRRALVRADNQHVRATIMNALRRRTLLGEPDETIADKAMEFLASLRGDQ